MKLNKAKKIILLIIFAIAVTLAFYGYREYNRKKVPMQEAVAQFVLSANQITNEFVLNETEATKKYNGKTVLINGKVLKKEVKDSSATIMLEGVNSDINVLCEIDLSSKKNLEKLATGQLVSIKGICAGALLDVVLNDCIINNP